MITSDRMAAVDRNAEALGVPQRQLMESSGNAIARDVVEMVDQGASVTIVCGRGNNGGDGFASARFLEAYAVDVRLIGSEDGIATKIARANWRALELAEYDLLAMPDSRDIVLPSCDLIVDALVGTGIRGELREPEATAVRRINDHEADVLSVDVPSGMNADTGESVGDAVEADRIVTFHDEKPGLRDVNVPVTVADIGIPAAAERFVGPGDLRSITRDPESHKGDSGRILVIGGGPYTGAPTLTALASLRAGADLGIVACPERIADTVQSFAPDLIVRPFAGDRLEPDQVSVLTELAANADVAVLGPGLGDARATFEAVGDFLARFSGRCVVDADALEVIPRIDTDASLVCTPHQGELEDMGGPREEAWRDRMSAVERFAAELGHTIVVKGRYDVISNGDRTQVNRTGNPGMTVGGTGDVLAGTIAAFLADRRREPVAAGAIGAYVTGSAGDSVEEEHGYGLVASDVVDALPAVIWGDRS